MLFVTMIITSVMILNSIGEFVLRMRNIINVMVAVFVVNCNLVSWSLYWPVEMGETVRVTRRRLLESHENRDRHK